MAKLFVVPFILLYGIGMTHGQEMKSTANGVFTEEQVKKGGVAYDANCASCHGADLRSTDREVPHLFRLLLSSKWIGKSVAEMFEGIRDTMPPEQKHSLEDQVYLDILAYILRFNKVPAGGEYLTPNVQVLKQIVIEKPPG